MWTYIGGIFAFHESAIRKQKKAAANVATACYLVVTEEVYYLKVDVLNQKAVLIDPHRLLVDT